jgi:hypothetical protein
MCLKVWKKKKTVRIKIEIEFVLEYKGKNNCKDQNIEFWSKKHYVTKKKYWIDSNMKFKDKKKYVKKNEFTNLHLTK